MSTFYRFLVTYEGLIYILLALVGLFSFRWLRKSWREWRDSIFGLEREISMRRLSQSLIISLLIVILFFSELFMASFVIPALPASVVIFTPTLDILAQSDGILPSDSNTALTSVTPEPDSQAMSTSGCVSGQLNLTFPEPGQEVSGTITLIGTVDIENFGFYKYEVSPQGADAWATISAGKEIIRNGELGLWDTSALTPGDYQIRLDAADNQGQLRPPCVISVRVVSP